MSPIGSVYTSAIPQALARAEGLREKSPLGPGSILPDGMRPAPNSLSAGGGFGTMLDGLVDTVSSKQAAASDLTKRVLLGESDQLHQSVIAMQEASVAFTLMVEVRNKLVESYQELMRMQV
ncbi:MAG: flagellar hook-basal body complex protein FliE [Candidatus Didemnitutus sp.]|nr:flagellar hook-basal body complex protein FliE [Candidatus Didemnitutus sp.]